MENLLIEINFKYSYRLTIFLYGLYRFNALRKLWITGTYSGYNRISAYGVNIYGFDRQNKFNSLEELHMYMSDRYTGYIYGLDNFLALAPNLATLDTHHQELQRQIKCNALVLVILTTTEP